jgi:N-acetylglucosaminyl-diphospho-decaprenol L-rhamnosyltransferase
MSAQPFSIVVVTWECAGFLRALVESLNRHLDGRQQLVVVDNASTDDVEAAARTWRGPLTFVRLDENRGFGAANNVGVERAEHAGVVLLNPDTELLDGRLGALVDAALELDGLAGPRVVNPDGSVQPSASGPEIGVWPWVRAIVPGVLTPRLLLRHTEPYRLERRTRVAWLTGACVAGPRDLLRALGPFDPEIHLYGEDLDLGLRAGLAGIPSVFCPETCRILHRAGGSSALVYGSADGWRPDGTSNWRAVLRRTYGRRRETLGWWALTVNLGLRAGVKRALRRTTARDRAAFSAALRARRFRELPPARVLDRP